MPVKALENKEWLGIVHVAHEQFFHSPCTHVSTSNIIEKLPTDSEIVVFIDLALSYIVIICQLFITYTVHVHVFAGFFFFQAADHSIFCIVQLSSL